jgi:hypothetical protein
MKKIILASTIIGLSLVFQSFTNNRTTNNVNFNNLDNASIELIESVGSFEEAQESYYDGDKGTWNYRYKKWTLNFTEASTPDIEEVITRN